MSASKIEIIVWLVGLACLWYAERRYKLMANFNRYWWAYLVVIALIALLSDVVHDYVGGQ